MSDNQNLNLSVLAEIDGSRNGQSGMRIRISNHSKVSACRSNAPSKEGPTWAGEGSRIIHHCYVTPEIVATESL